MTDKPEIVLWTGEFVEQNSFKDGHHTFQLGFDEGLPICGYTEFEYDRICICPPRHYGQPHFVITGQAHHRFPTLRVLGIICHDDEE